MVYDADAVSGLKREKEMANIRWRLVMGLASLVAAIVLTLPAGAAAAGNLQRASADIWPNIVMAEIWPNDPSNGSDILYEIWPN